MLKKMKLTAVPLLALGLLALLTGCGKKQSQQTLPNAAQVATYTVTTGSLNLENTYPATIKGYKDVEVRPQVSGTITRVCVEEGQHVSAGEPLFYIDEVTLQAAVESARAAVASAQSGVVSSEAQIASAQSAVAQAQLTANNQKKLYDKGIISSYQYETAALSLKSAQEQLAQARSAKKSAQAGVSQAQAALVQAQKNLSYSRVDAPCSGVVGSIPNREGSLASPSVALTTISQNDRVYAYFSFNEKELISLTNGGAKSLQAAISQMPQVRLRLSDGTIYAQPGRVETMAGVLNQSTGSVSVRALFPNVNGMLRSGATGNVLIPVSTSNLLVIPQAATYEVQDQMFVYKVGADKKAVATAIKVLSENDGVHYAVTQGLKAGDVIVAEGVGTKVKEGTQILTAQEAAAMAKQAAAAQKK